MSDTTSPPLTPGTAPAASPEVTRLPTADIDASLRAPVIFLFTSATLWLAFGTLLALLASVKLHGPGFMSGSAWSTYGRLAPAAMNSLLYGFASQAALGVLLWLLGRLGGNALCCRPPLLIAGAFWNLGVFIGVMGIFCDGGTGFQWLEMPRHAVPILFAAYAVIGVCALVTFHQRRERSLYVSQWYLLAALFWFPWMYSAANYLLLFNPVRGVMQSVVNAWFTNNLLGLWLAPVGLAAIFYFLPKLVLRPLYSRPLAAFGFWTLALFTNWTGLTPLIGGPLPAWMPALSASVNLLMIVPLVCVALNWFCTLQGVIINKKTHTTVLRFILFGAVCYLLWAALNIVTGLRGVSEVTQFTYVTVAKNYLALLGFFAMTLFGSIYYIVPRLTQVEWPSARLVRVHYLLSAIGVGVIVVALGLGGVLQGLKLNKPEVNFLDVMNGVRPFAGLFTLGLLLALAGQLAFLKNLFTLLHICGADCRKAALAFVTGADTVKAGGKA